jgi:hypothetical protein
MTTGKTITTEQGRVVTDVGPATVDGAVDPILRRVVGDDGVEGLMIARVVRETPETIRRASFDWRPF